MAGLFHEFVLIEQGPKNRVDIKESAVSSGAPSEVIYLQWFQADFSPLLLKHILQNNHKLYENNYNLTTLLSRQIFLVFFFM